MSLPIFPQNLLTPGDGTLVRFVAGATSRTLGGVVLELLTIDCQDLPAGPDLGRFGAPLLETGTTLWLRGLLQVDLHGEAVAASWNDVLTDWLDLRALLLGHEGVDVEVLAPPAPAEPVLLPDLAFLVVRGWWHDPAAFRYELGACNPAFVPNS